MIQRDRQTDKTDKYTAMHWNAKDASKGHLVCN
jgi:hypothetical protein